MNACVSILVVMESAQEGIDGTPENQSSIVSILVVMESAQEASTRRRRASGLVQFQSLL